MRTLTFLCLGLIICNIALTQSITALDSFHLYTYEDDEWQLSSGDLYSQLSDGSVETDRFEILDGDIRNFTTSIITQFDSSGNEIENVVSVYDEVTGNLNPSSMTTFDYDASNNLIKRVRQLWDATLMVWVNVEKWEYSAYDNFNNFGKTENFNHTEADGWLLANSIDLDNRYENMLLDTVSTVRNGEQWYTRAFDYSSDDLLMENRTVFYFSDEINHLTKTTYDYNDLDQRSWRYYEFYTPPAGDVDYIPGYRDNFEYTTDGEISSIVNEDYDVDNNDYFFDEKLVYFYPQSTGLYDFDDSKVSVQWSNTQFNQLQLKVTDLTANENYILSIYDASGRMVKNLRINQSTQWENRYSLSGGIHYVVLQSEAGSKHTEKVIVH